MPPGTCDVLLSERGPSCFLTEQITGKKFYMVRFIDADKNKARGQQSAPQAKAKSCGSMRDTVASVVNMERRAFVKTTGTGFAAYSLPKMPSTAFSKSISVADLIAAGKLFEPQEVSNVTLVLQSYNVSEKSLKTVSTITALMETEKFEGGGFRDAFRATSIHPGMPTKWVIKKAQQDRIGLITSQLNLTNLQHTRKQVQTNAVERTLAQNFARKAHTEFGKCFNYKKV